MRSWLAALLAVVIFGTATSAAPAGTIVAFRNGAAFCIGYNVNTSGGFVGCSARIHGAWQSVLLLRSGRPVKAHQAAQAASSYQPLRTNWHGGPFVCTVTPGGVICVNT